MASKKITELSAFTTPTDDDLLVGVDNPGGAPETKKITWANIKATLKTYLDTLYRPVAEQDGWIVAGETWTYASADAPTFTFTIVGDKTGKYSAGMKLKLTQTTVKYFIITAISYGAPNTTVTVYGGTDYTMTGDAITLPYYSTAKAPFGFPITPAKWQVKATDSTLRTQATPTQSVWYNLGALSISIPIGVWRVSYKVAPQLSDSTAVGYGLLTTLSNANNSESDAEFTTSMTSYVVTAWREAVYLRKDTPLTLAAKTSYYLNTQTSSANVDAIYNRNDQSAAVIVAECAYL